MIEQAKGNVLEADVLPLIQHAIEQLPTNIEVVIYEPVGAADPANMAKRTECPEMSLSRANVLAVLSEYCVFGYELSLVEIQKKS